jgi:hypothetical protein
MAKIPKAARAASRGVRRAGVIRADMIRAGARREGDKVMGNSLVLLVKINLLS